jgi:3-isopropylmalate dehydrogenase
MKIAILPGDGIGTEIVAEAVKVLNALDLKFEMETAPSAAPPTKPGHRCPNPR